MSTTTNKLYLIFKTENDRTHSVIVDLPKSTLTASEIQEVMDAILASNLIEGSNGKLLECKEAKFIERSVTPVELVI